jgi:hypothetical protein
VNASPPTWRCVRSTRASGGFDLLATLDIRGTGQKRPRIAYRRQSVWENPILSSLSQAAFLSLLGHEAYNRRHSLSAFLSPAAVPVPSPHQSTSDKALLRGEIKSQRPGTQAPGTHHRIGPEAASRRRQGRTRDRSRRCSPSREGRESSGGDCGPGLVGDRPSP